MAARIIANTETVAVGTVVPHPRNPRRGNVDAIAESLTAHGQYRPIVANKRTNHILAGTHTWRAAKKIGWRKIAISWVDVDDAGELRILLADNRASDLATYDDSLLAELLRSLPTLDGTGYTLDDLDTLDGLYKDTNTTSSPDITEPELIDAELRIGPHHLIVERDPFNAWTVPIEQSTLKPEETIRRRLNLPKKDTPRRSDPETTPVRLSTVSDDITLIETLEPYPGNARQGDIGAIAESLQVNGQFRPIVANTRTRQILVGNHTHAAALALGWDSIAVTWIDVDEEEARRIVLIDNRTADLGTYNTETLTTLLTGLSTDLTGTGWTGDDLDDLLAGAAGRPSKPVNTDTRITVDRWTLKVPTGLFTEWDRTLGPNPIPEIARRLQLPPGTWSIPNTPTR